jgi:hypothetical protein
MPFHAFSFSHFYIQATLENVLFPRNTNKEQLTLISQEESNPEVQVNKGKGNDIHVLH